MDESRRIAIDGRRGRRGSSGRTSSSAVLAPWEVGGMIVVGIETSTPQTSVAIGTETEIVGEGRRWRAGRGRSPSRRRWSSCSSGATSSSRRSAASRSGIGPGPVHGAARRACETAKTLAQVLARADRRASRASTRSRTPSATRTGGSWRSIDARRGEVFFAIYRRRARRRRCASRSTVGRHARPSRRPSWRPCPARCWPSATVRCCTDMCSRRSGAASSSRRPSLAHPDAAVAGRARRAAVPPRGARPSRSTSSPCT